MRDSTMDKPIVLSATRPAGNSSNQVLVPTPPKSAPTPIRNIGVVGLGRMGHAFAQNLLSDGYKITAYDRDGKRARDLQFNGARAAARLEDLASCDIIVSSLPEDAALAAVALSPGGLASILAPGSVHISMSTVSPGLSRRLDAAHAARGQGFVAAPVLGNPDAAGARRLYVLAGGACDAVERARPVLESVGQRVFVIGDDAGAASLIKLAGNTLTAATLQSMGEVLALLRKGGIDARVGFDVFTNSLFDSRVHRIYGAKILNETYTPPGMVVPLAEKDLRLALAEAERHAVPMPAAGLVRDRLATMVARGWAGLDWSALGLLAASEAGLDAATTAAAGHQS
jgi:3-hydroxyisobutyrate dehydrogenase-like beta-hydroxyacid dehydrogenase